MLIYRNFLFVFTFFLFCCKFVFTTEDIFMEGQGSKLKRKLKEDIITNYKSCTEDQIFFHIREAKYLNGYDMYGEWMAELLNKHWWLK